MKIDVYDDIFSFTYKSKLYSKVVNSSFKIGWLDTENIEDRDKVFMYSSMNSRKREIIRNINNEDLLGKINNRIPFQIIINCGTPNDEYLPHSHPGQDVLLYYANLKWEPSWNGDTIFYSEDLSKIIFANPYISGRAIFFDGEIPHSIKPNSPRGPKFRFTISMFFNKEEYTKGRGPSQKNGPFVDDQRHHYHNEHRKS